MVSPLSPRRDARDHANVDANYAIHLPLIDMMMGTFKRPPAGQWPEEYGVLELETVPRGFLAQGVSPFSSGRRFADFVGKAPSDLEIAPQ